MGKKPTRQPRESGDENWDQFTFLLTPDPEFLRSMQKELLNAMGKACDKYMRTPQFLSVMKEWFELLVSIQSSRKNTSEKLRSELTAMSREDVWECLKSIHHIESRVTDKLDELAEVLDKLSTVKQKKLSFTAARRRDQLNNHPTQGRSYAVRGGKTTRNRT